MEQYGSDRSLTSKAFTQLSGAYYLYFEPHEVNEKGLFYWRDGTIANTACGLDVRSEDMFTAPRSAWFKTREDAERYIVIAKIRGDAL